MKLSDMVGYAVGLLEKYTPFRYPVHAYQEEVSPGILWRGSRIKRPQVEDLVKRGFKTVVDLCSEHTADDNLSAIKGFDIQFMHIPIIDSQPPKMEQAERFLSLFKDPRNMPVFVHCQAGQGRTGTMVAIYRIRVQGWTAEDAIKDGARHKLCLPGQLEFIRRFK
jgi:tyrosine-protein phosphatase SIW14